MHFRWAALHAGQGFGMLLHDSLCAAMPTAGSWFPFLFILPMPLKQPESGSWIVCFYLSRFGDMLLRILPQSVLKNKHKNNCSGDVNFFFIVNMFMLKANQEHTPPRTLSSYSGSSTNLTMSYCLETILHKNLDCLCGRQSTYIILGVNLICITGLVIDLV